MTFRLRRTSCRPSSDSPHARRALTRLVLMASAVSLLVVIACESPRPEIISHRAQGGEGSAFGGNEFGENLVINIAPLLAEGIGVEIDIRADGERPFELGHNEPQGENLEDALTAIDEAWTSDFDGQILVIDIANDDDDMVTQDLIPYLEARVPGNNVQGLVFIVQSSFEPSLFSMRQQALDREVPFQIRFAFTQWIAPEYTVPDWVDYLVANVNELPTYPFPVPVIVFGISTRSSYEQAVTHPSEIFGVLTNHPRRIVAWQPE